MIKIKDISYKDIEFSGVIYKFFLVESFDGTPLSVQRIGNPKNKPLFLANGIGVSWYGLHYLVKELSKNYCVYTWDYRGIGESTPCFNNDFSINTHGKDLIFLIDHFGYKNSILGGWSMGVPVLIEAYRENPEKISKMALLFGAPGLPFESILGKTQNFIFLKTIRAMMDNIIIPVLLRKGIGLNQNLLELSLKLSGFSSFNADKDIFSLCVDGVLKSDLKAYGETLYELGIHNGWDLLPQIEIPCFVTAGGMDWVSPTESIEKMASLIKNSEFKYYPRATHFGIMEVHEIMLKSLNLFLTDSKD
jgi:pimeloyl-ACP methyl ester carboxylesterase